MEQYSVVPFRMSPEEKKMLKEICQERDLSMAQWMRRAIKAAYARKQKKA